MSKLRILLIILTFGLTLVSAARAQTGENVDVAAGINHDEFDRLLKKYVNEQGLVNYGAWKQNAADLSALDDYLKQFAAKIDKPALGNEKAASLVNSYNALVLRWILPSYPIESIWQLKDSFSGKRNEVGGRKISLDDIEHGTLRALMATARTLRWFARHAVVRPSSDLPMRLLNSTNKTTLRIARGWRAMT